MDCSEQFVFENLNINSIEELHARWGEFSHRLYNEQYRIWFIYCVCVNSGRLQEFGNLIHPDILIDGGLTDINPRQYFGKLVDFFPELPEDYAEIMVHTICDRLQDRNLEMQVDMYGRFECELPDDWTVPLVRKLIARGVRVRVGRTCPSLMGHASVIAQ